MISGHGFKVIVDSAEQLYTSRCKGLRADAIITELQIYSLILVFKFISFISYPPFQTVLCKCQVYFPKVSEAQLCTMKFKAVSGSKCSTNLIFFPLCQLCVSYLGYWSIWHRASTAWPCAKGDTQLSLLCCLSCTNKLLFGPTGRKTRQLEWLVTFP